MKKSIKAFSIIEILVWMIVFLFWIASIYSIISSNIWLNHYNKNYIIWVNLAKEQLELFRNIRDINFKKIKSYNYINPECETSCSFFEDNKIYKISNNFSSTSIIPKVEEKNIIIDLDDLSKLKESDLKDYQICFSKKDSLYDYCNNISWEKEYIKMYKFIKTSNIWTNYKSAWKIIDIKKAIKIKSVVIWYSKRYSKYEVDEIFTNYKIY